MLFKSLKLTKKNYFCPAIIKGAYENIISLYIFTFLNSTHAGN